MKSIPLSEVKSDLPRYLQEAQLEEILITRDGEPAGLLVGFESDDDLFDYKLENDPRFLARIAKARASYRAGKFTRLEDLPR
ncbi:MAG: type II toxin-antitoxin system Phd/YefM family antitoxin [Planctomycetota bacterium]